MKLKQGVCINLEGWDGDEDGREVQKGGDICIPMAGSGFVWQQTKFCKPLSFNKKINLKKGDITLLTKVHIVIAMVFPVVIYGCESWTIKETERQRIDTFEFGAEENSWEYFGLQEDQASQF